MIIKMTWVVTYWGRCLSRLGAGWKALRQFFSNLSKPFSMAIRNVFLLTGWLFTTAATLVAQDVHFFRIATGSVGTTFFPLGGVIATAISNPAGARGCEQGGNCGVPGLVAVAQTTQGSVLNVVAVATQQFESGLSQADVALWAFRAEHIFKGKTPLENLRVIASLYQESLHVVVSADSPIRNIQQLIGKRISLGEKDSGTNATALAVLEAYGIDDKKANFSNDNLRSALEALRGGSLDAIFVVGSYPLPALVDYTQTASIRLLQIDGEGATVLRQKYPFLGIDVIPEGSYRDVNNAVTLGISTLWVTSAEVPDDLIYKITRALWNTTTKKLTDSNNPIVRRMRFETALSGIPIPIHPGAAKFYSELEKTNPQ